MAPTTSGRRASEAAFQIWSAAWAASGACCGCAGWPGSVATAPSRRLVALQIRLRDGLVGVRVARFPVSPSMFTQTMFSLVDWKSPGHVLEAPWSCIEPDR